VGTVDDLVSLSDFAWQRLRDRMAGLMDAELRWRPAPGDQDISLEWRLNHIATLLAEDRNAVWLDQTPASTQLPEAQDAVQTLELLDASYALWRKVLTSLTDESLDKALGPRAGFYGKDTRRSFVLHILDELIHHGAEAALLRDLYGHRS
jgi:uncharacterized damage-inducible protein DinB